MHRQAKRFGKRHHNAAFGRTVKLGHNQPANISSLLKGFDLTKRVLTHSAVKNNDRIMRCGIIQFADHPHDFAQLIHQFGAVLQPPGGINNQNINLFFSRLFHSCIGKCRSIAAGFTGNHLGTGAITPDLQLLNSRRTERIGGGQHDFFSLLVPLLRQFAGGCGFARTIDPDQKQNMRPVRRVWQKRCGNWLQNLGNGVGQRQRQTIGRHRPVKFMLAHGLGQPRRRCRPKIGADQRILDLFKR